MDEIELIRTLRDDLPEPDAGQRQQARTALVADADRESRRTPAARRMAPRLLRRRTLAIAIGALVLPAGLAVAATELISEDEQARDSAVTAREAADRFGGDLDAASRAGALGGVPVTDCGEAVAAKLQVHGIERVGPDCAAAARIADRLPEHPLKPEDIRRLIEKERAAGR